MTSYINPGKLYYRRGLKDVIFGSRKHLSAEELLDAFQEAMSIRPDVDIVIYNKYKTAGALPAYEIRVVIKDG